MSAQKRHRGAQPGNQNARKHPLVLIAPEDYALVGEASTIMQCNLDEALVAQRAVLRSLLENDPGNITLLNEAVQFLKTIYCAKQTVSNWLIGPRSPLIVSPNEAKQIAGSRSIPGLPPPEAIKQLPARHGTCPEPVEGFVSPNQPAQEQISNTAGQSHG